MRIQLSDHFTYKKLFRFVLPSIGMMLFTSIYSVVDGFFVSNFAGDTPFAAINLIWPFLMLFSAIGFMIGAGGTALVSFYLGTKNREKANDVFSLLVYLLIALGLVTTILGEVILKDVAIRLGATDEMLPYCVEYGRILMLAIVPFMLQNMFQSFMVAAEKPKLGLLITVLSGITNMVLDALLVGVWKLGVAGAAYATAISQIVGGIIPLIYFLLPNSGLLRLGKATFDGRAIKKACLNGASEFMTNISLSIVTMVYNIQLLRFAGEDGVSAYGVVMYVCFVFIAAFIGYGIGTAPIIAFHYGAGNEKELQNIFRKSLIIIAGTSLLMFLAAELLTGPVARIFVGYDAELAALTKRAFSIYSVSFLMMGFNIFGSSFFTSLNNGAVSAAISFLRTLLFQIIAVLVLPLFLQIDGVWVANIAAELLALCVTAFFMKQQRKKYHY